MKKYIIIALHILIFIPGNFLYAAGETNPATPSEGYTVLTPLPGTTIDGCTTTDCKADINSYLGGFIGLVISVGAVLAMIFLGLYGFQYAVSDSAPKKSEFKDKIGTILQGLLLIISAYTIMYTINPDLVDVELNLRSPKFTDTRVALDTAGTTSTNTSGGTRVVNGRSVIYGECTACMTALINGTTVTVASDLMLKLQKLNEISKINVTESWPPTRNHLDSCHKIGTCVDVTTNDLSPSGITNFITAAKNLGSGAVFESNNAALVNQVKAQLRAAGLDERYALYLPTCTKIDPPPGGCVTGTHYSIYNTLKY